MAQPSVSAQGVGVSDCAALLHTLMMRLGIRTRKFRLLKGNPILYGEVGVKSPRKTLLLYGHYDVQPPEPLEEWHSHPFKPIVRAGKIIARGAADSKSNILSCLFAANALSRMCEENGVQVKLLLEGEEEISSPNLPGFVQGNRDLLSTDSVVCFDGGKDESGRPRINLGLKGILYLELSCRKAMRDLHSSRGAIVPNPAWRLVWALNSIRSNEGKIAVRGWYDHVQPPTNEQRVLLAKIPFDPMRLKQDYGIAAFMRGLEKPEEVLNASLFEPTATVCGFKTGYTGAGPKTVLPSEAFAKIDFRLAFDQKPEDLFRKLRQHLDAKGFSDVEMKSLGMLQPSRTMPSAGIVDVASRAAKRAYGEEPVVYPNMAASGPDYVFTKILGRPSIWTGCSLPEGRAHAPNEFTTKEAFFKGIEYAKSIIEEFCRT